MNSNTVPTNRLKLVRCSLEDPQTRKIAARMGMSVAQFMTSLGYPQPHGSAGDLPKCLVWPKHTDFEIRDPYASVYQYEPRDSSWSLRFRALGCYNVLPRLPSEPVEENRINESAHTLNNPSNLTSKLELGSNSDGNSHSPVEQLHSLLKSRSLTSSNLELPSETITQAERNKLLDDLRLTDSEDEDESGPKLCAKNDQNHAVVDEQTAPKKGGTLKPEKIEPDRSQNSSDHLAVPSAKKISNVIDAFGDPFSQIVNPPPLVSPLSVMGDDAHSDRPYQTPLLQETRPTKPLLCPSEMPTSDITSNTLNNRVSPQRPQQDGDLSSSTNQVPDRSASSGPLVQKQLPMLNLAKASSQLESQARTFSAIQDEHMVGPGAQNHSPTIQSNVIEATRGFKSKLAPIPGKESVAPPFDTVNKNSDYIRRLLMESEAFLAAKEDLRVTELSPRSANPWKYNNDSMLLDKENVVVEPAEDALSVTSRSSFTELDKMRETSTPLSSPNNFSKQVLSVPIQPENRRVHNATDITAAQCGAGRTKSTLEQIALSKKTDELLSSASPTAASTECNIPIPEKNIPTTPPASPKQNDRLTASDSVPFSTSKTKNVDQQRRNQKITVETTDTKSSDLKTDLLATKLSKLERKRSRKSGSRPSEPPSVTKNDSTLLVSAVPDDEHPKEHTNMPPPSSEGSNDKRSISNEEKPLDSTDASRIETIRSDQPDDLTVARLEHESSNSSSTLSLHASKSDIKLSTGAETFSAPLTSTTTTAPVLRKIPNKRWVFSDVALKKVRSKLKSVFEESSPSQTKDDTMPRDFLDKIREALLSICSSRQQCSPKETDINGRSRTLTGVLLVPPPIEHVNIHPLTEPNPIVHKSPIRNDTATMTSPSLTKIFAETLDVAIQYTLSPVSQSEEFLSNSNGTCQVPNIASSSPPKCSQCRIRLDQVTAEPVTTTDLRVAGSEVIEYMLNEERELQNSTVEIQLDHANECKNNASRCWKTLVGAVSDSQSGLRHAGDGRSRLLLSLNDLHLYPVYLLQGVRHYLAAAYLLHAQGDTTRAVELCVEATAQLDHISRRLQRVETKLTRYRVPTQHGTSDSSEGVATADRPIDVQARAKRDASWIHLWYYVIARIRSMIRSHEYQLRLIIDASILDEMENDPGLSFTAERSTGSSHTCGTGDSKTESNKSSAGRIGSLLSPSVRPSPSTGAVESKLGSKLAQLPNGSLEPGRFSPEDKVPVRTSTMDRIQRLLKLNALMRRAAHDWSESEKLAFGVPRLPVVSSAQNALLTRLASSSDPISGPSIDFIIGHAAGGAFPTSQYTNVITLMCFIDGVVKVHTALIEHLKLCRAADDTSTVTVVSLEAPPRTINGKQQTSSDAPSENTSEPLAHSSTETPADHAVKKPFVHSANECTPSPGEPVQKKHKKIRSKQPVPRNQSEDRSSSVTIPPVKSETERSNPQPRGKHKPSDLVSSDKVSKRGKRIRLVESDDPKLWDSSLSSNNSTTLVKADTGSSVPNKQCGYQPSQMEQSIPNKSLEALDTVASEVQSIEKSFEKPRQLTKLDNTTRRNLTGSLSRDSSESGASSSLTARTVANPVAGRLVSGLPSTPNEHDSQVETTSPDYTASTPSPPPMRPRSKSLAPTSSTQRPCIDSGSEVDSRVAYEAEQEKGKRKNFNHVDSEEKDWSDENTYQPKRVRTFSSGKSYPTNQSGMESPSPDSSPFPSYRPSIPDELDKARRRRRSSSVGRSLLHNSNIEAGPKDPQTTDVTAKGYDPMHSGSHPNSHAMNGSAPNGRSSTIYSHLKTAYASSKVNAAGKGDIPSYYEGWLNQSQSQAPSNNTNKGQNHNKYYDLQKRYGKSRYQ